MYKGDEKQCFPSICIRYGFKFVDSGGFGFINWRICNHTIEHVLEAIKLKTNPRVCTSNMAHINRYRRICILFRAEREFEAILLNIVSKAIWTNTPPTMHIQSGFKFTDKRRILIFIYRSDPPPVGKYTFAYFWTRFKHVLLAIHTSYGRASINNNLFRIKWFFDLNRCVFEDNHSHT